MLEVLNSSDLREVERLGLAIENFLRSITEDRTSEVAVSPNWLKWPTRDRELLATDSTANALILEKMVDN